MIEAQIAIDSRETLKDKFSLLPPEEVYKLAKAGWHDERYAQKLRADREVQIAESEIPI